MERGALLRSLLLIPSSLIVLCEFLTSSCVVPSLCITQNPSSTLVAASVASLVAHMVSSRQRDIPKRLFIGFALFCFLYFVYGGDFLSGWSKALSFALYMSSAFVVPSTSSPTISSLQVSGVGNPSRFLCAGAIAAWIGCFAIPLDWDRPWQPFPISSTILASFIALVPL